MNEVTIKRNIICVVVKCKIPRYENRHLVIVVCRHGPESCGRDLAHTISLAISIDNMLY